MGNNSIGDYHHDSFKTEFSSSSSEESKSKDFTISVPMFLQENITDKKLEDTNFTRESRNKEQKAVTIKVSLLAKRLGLGEDVIRKNHADGTLNALVQKKINIEAQNEKSHYDKSIKTEYIGPTKVDPLMIFQKAVLSYLLRREDSTHGQFFVGKEQILVGKEKENEPLELLSVGKSFAKGTNKSVRLLAPVFDKSQENEILIIAARRFKNSEESEGIKQFQGAFAEITSEQEKLLSLHEEAKSKGVTLKHIQNPFVRKITVAGAKNKSGEPVRDLVAFVVKNRYTCDVEQLFDNPTELPSIVVRAELAKQAVIAGSLLNQLGYKDHDVKVENLGYRFEAGNEAEGKPDSHLVERFDLSLIKKDRKPEWKTTPIDWETGRDFMSSLSDVLGGICTFQLTPHELLTKIQIAARDSSHNVDGALAKYVDLCDRHARFLEATMSCNILTGGFLGFEVDEPDERRIAFPTRDEYLNDDETGLKIFMEEFSEKYLNKYFSGESEDKCIDTLASDDSIEEIAQCIQDHLKSTDRNSLTPLMLSFLEDKEKRTSTLKNLQILSDKINELEAQIETDEEENKEGIEERIKLNKQNLSNLKTEQKMRRLELTEAKELIGVVVRKFKNDKVEWTEDKDLKKDLRVFANGAFEAYMGYSHPYETSHPKLGIYKDADGTTHVIDRLKILNVLGFYTGNPEKREDISSIEELKELELYRGNQPPDSVLDLLSLYERAMDPKDELPYQEFLETLEKLLSNVKKDLALDI